MITANDNGKQPITFVVAVNDDKVYQENVLASPIFQPGHRHELLVRRGFSSAGAAYNDTIAMANNDLMVFMHQDMYLPDGWDMKLQRVIESFERTGVKWGVLGCFGISSEGAPVGHVYSNGLKMELGFPQAPVKAQSLDEIVLVIRKSGGLRFDPMLSYFHLYGTDICIESKKRGFENYVISNFCIHNSLPINRLPVEFWRCAEYLRRKWFDELPIKTCCITLSSLKIIMNLKQLWAYAFPNKTAVEKNRPARLSDPASFACAGRN